MFFEKLNHQEIVARQKIRQKKSKLKFCAILNNIRSLYNVGSIFRTADGVGLEKLWLCGITGCPPNNQITKTALGAQDVLPWEYRKDAYSLASELKVNGYSIILLEQIKDSVPYHKMKVSQPVCLVLGNEITGISDNLLRLCDQAVEIEMKGIKNSLNVAVAFGIVSYHIKQKLDN